MWVRVEDNFYNTDAIISLERRTDAAVYYVVRFVDRNETGFNEKQIRPLLDALAGLAEKDRQQAGESHYEPAGDHAAYSGTDHANTRQAQPERDAAEMQRS